MATNIVVEKKKWDEMWDVLLDKLKLDKFEARQDAQGLAENTALGQLHRKFHYEVCGLKQKLEET